MMDWSQCLRECEAKRIAPDIDLGFLKEIVKDSSLADEFDDLRRIRNDINYYGKDASIEEAGVAIKRLVSLRKHIGNLVHQFP